MYILIRKSKQTTKLQNDDYALKGPQKLVRQKCRSQPAPYSQEKKIMASIRCVNKSKVIYKIIQGILVPRSQSLGSDTEATLSGSNSSRT